MDQPPTDAKACGDLSGRATDAEGGVPSQGALITSNGRVHDETLALLRARS